ncbi:serine/threonine-protein kinase [Pseudofrankia asymbiotica]|uniref:non-specific serine/threonine protein kinase n=1 Tax=Pseudofrankia asymbiotica TaxID=1834516 RepID=A0A1V2I674_9ACTN|nr:serine/threonine-protein kinase [Pseudofrankia asymbiotica]ONH25388.1 serine/threonine protein kinase [Pseudofrankia asymbiotica]
MIVDRERVEKALPGYHIAERLGSGASGLVLAGEHLRIGRPVAIKVMGTEDAGDSTDGFAAEARVLATLDHPHVLRVHDYVEAEGLCLVVMELLAGGTLTDRQVGIGPEQACAVGLAVAGALAHAHGHGVLHRDIKPSNILFAADGTPKVSDYGLAKLLEGSAATASRMVGTPLYMAPEQIQGGRLGPGTDLYALGMVLYRLLAGQPPFDPKLPAPALWFQHATEPPPPMTGVDPRLAAVVLRALAKSPEDRHPDATAFALDLARAATQALGSGWTARAGLPLHLDDAVRRAADDSQDRPASQPNAPACSETPQPVTAQATEPASLVAPRRSPAAVPPEPSASSALEPLVGSSSPPAETDTKAGVAKGGSRRGARLAAVGAVVAAALAIPAVLFGPEFLSGGDQPAARGGTDPLVTASPQDVPATSASETTHPSFTPTALGTSAPAAAISTQPQAPASSAVASGTAPARTNPPPNPGQAGPASPENDPNYQQGSAVDVPGCAGWMDYANLLYGTLSAGAASCAGEVTTTDEAYGAEPSSVSLTAANHTEANSSPPAFLYFGYYKFSVRICIWNQNDPTGRRCSPVYVDTQGSISRR